MDFVSIDEVSVFFLDQGRHGDDEPFPGVSMGRWGGDLVSYVEDGSESQCNACKP